MAALALTAGIVQGGPAVTLCIARDGHVDFKLAAQPCEACPVAGCPGKSPPPVESEAPALPLEHECCYDVPLSIDWHVSTVPRGSDASDVAAIAPAVIPIDGIEAAFAWPRAIGPPDDPLPHHVRHALTCLHSVLLLL
jgi:hypothetical protein